MYRCTVTQYDIELYGWSVMWEYAESAVDAILAGAYRFSISGIMYRLA
jgi:hypothetical protein